MGCVAMAGYNRIRYRLSRNALILFVGINPHHGSYRRAVPFSNNKTFWYILNRSGVINENLSDLRDDAKLRKVYDSLASKYRVNFINLVDRPTRDVSELRRGEEQNGNERLVRAIARYKPGMVCFVGKITYQKFTGKSRVTYGFKERICGAQVYVARFPLRGRMSVRVREMRMLIGRARPLR